MTSEKVNWPAEAILEKLDDHGKKLEGIKTVLLGVAGTDERGLVGEVKAINNHLGDHSKRLTILEQHKLAIWTVIGLLVVATGMAKLFGVL